MPTAEEQEELFNEELRKAKMLIALHERVFGVDSNETEKPVGEEVEESEGEKLLTAASRAISWITSQPEMGGRGQALAQALEAITGSRTFPAELSDETMLAELPTIHELEFLEEKDQKEDEKLTIKTPPYKLSLGSRGFERFIPTGVPLFGTGMSRFEEAEDK
ncbi:hypothetical protein BC829DRAFT_142346 [Chytridium lagenaria]|nr:hypothetical protein BC829DRAFT_142346 [Chytridium lagenaria]